MCWILLLEGGFSATLAALLEPGDIVKLLARSDHDLHGVPGFEIDAAVCFVKLYSNNETLDLFSLIGNGDSNIVNGIKKLPTTVWNFIVSGLSIDSCFFTLCLYLAISELLSDSYSMF
ncbi:hypothetical protein ZIOFF_075087 [Zingiber officinale]|uniref:Uncharacterized protein n=1 Tax=Zingiber officinale TaxID=94328 RepID=A0A8J5ERQ4_ZINOF|nr:hypothetical protein ZIOFF_075087 [Zingiber officinale]